MLYLYLSQWCLLPLQPYVLPSLMVSMVTVKVISTFSIFSVDNVVLCVCVIRVHSRKKTMFCHIFYLKCANLYSNCQTNHTWPCFQSNSMSHQNILSLHSSPTVIWSCSINTGKGIIQISPSKSDGGKWVFNFVHSKMWHLVIWHPMIYVEHSPK
jgi:hypothetical protein